MDKRTVVKPEIFNFGPWVVTSKKGSILTAKDNERLTSELALPALPEMTFGENSLEIKHQQGFGIQFNGIDALQLVDNKHDLMKVAAADAWQRERQDSEFINEVVKPFDWTYTTDYKGTLTATNELAFKVSPTTQRIDMEKLKVKEKIYFYEDLILYEDELADNGIAKLNVKMRVMPSSLFLLLRFFLRVDGVLVRINDTRLYHEAGTNFFLREYTSREKPVSQIKGSLTDPASISDQLDIVKEIYEILEFPDSVSALSCVDSEKTN